MSLFYLARIRRYSGALASFSSLNPYNGTRLAELLSDVVWHLKGNGPWRYRLSEIYYSPEVDAAVDELLIVEKLKAA